MTARTDIHRPSLLDPAEYAFMGCFYQGSSDDMARCYQEEHKHLDGEIAIALAQGALIFEGNHVSKTTCDHCGAAFAHGVTFRHTPTNQIISVGHICAANTVGLPSRAVAARKAAERAQAEANKVAKIMEATAPWREENADMVAYLVAAVAREGAWRDENQRINDEQDGIGRNTLPKTHHFLMDMARTINKWGALSERQAAAVRKFMSSDAERAANPPAVEAAPEGPLVEGRREITGIVLSHKWQDGDYGTTHKMLVKEADGNKVWGTVPGSIEDALTTQHEDYTSTTEDLKGHTVTLTAKVTRSREDENFGFYSRPTGGRLVPSAV